MVEKRAGSPPTSSRMTRERRQAMVSNSVKTNEENKTSSESNHEDNIKTNNRADEMSKTKDEFVQLGRDLNMDVTTSDTAWSSYDAIKQNYTLEVSRFF